MLIPQSREKFLDEVFRRYLLNPFASLKTILRDDFLEHFFPEFRDSFLGSFQTIDGSDCNAQLFELWDMINRQPRYIFSSQKIDAHRFEVSAPLADFDYVEFALGLPLQLRVGQALYRSMIWSMGPEIRGVPYANNLRPVRPDALLGRPSKLVYNCKDVIMANFRRRMGLDGSSRLPRLDTGFRDHVESYLTSS